MELIIFAVIVLIVTALVCWAIDRAPFGDARLKWLIEALVVLLAALVILNRAGVV